MNPTYQKNGKQPQRPRVPMDHLTYGHVPPHAKELEQQVLGIMMMEAHRVFEVRQWITPEDFYLIAHQKICRAIYEVDEQTDKPEPTAVLLHLRSKGELDEVGGMYYLSVCTDKVVSSANTEKYCKLIKQFAVVRQLITFSGEMLNRALSEEDMQDLLAFADQELSGINQGLEASRSMSLEQIAYTVGQKWAERDESVRNPELLKNYVYSGIKAWDEITGYFRPRVYVVAARPGMGKTDFAVQLICNVAKRVPVGFASIEMDEDEVAQRIICNELELDNQVYVKPPELIEEWEGEKFLHGLVAFVNLKLHIDCTSKTIDRLLAKFRYWVRVLGVKLIVVDYLQIIQVIEELSRYMTEVQVLNHILEALASAAKELKTPIVLLSQLNRDLYKRGGNKEPGIADLKGSGKIEEIAYQISFLHRPEYYDITTDEFGESTRGLMYQLILKHRGGRTGRIKHKYRPQYSQIDEWDEFLPGGFKPDEDVPF